MSFWDRLKHGWNAFQNNRDPTEYRSYETGFSYGYRPDRPRLSMGNERSIITAVLNKIAIDAAQTTIQHCRLDDNGRFCEVIDSDLNKCLNLEANIDQTGRAFLHDVALSMLDEGHVAMIPIDTDLDPANGSFKILTMRTGKILEWRPKHVKVKAYDDNTGEKKDIVLEKRTTGIVENPFYAVMNEPNSTLKRLIRKLNILDVIDEQSGSGKLDLIVQLPYTIKTPARQEQADNRKKKIEEQLKGPYGIAYIDAAEHVTQLNRPVENNLMKQIEYLTAMLYSQLGITQSILDGTADEQTMLNYYNRTIEPIVSAIVDEMKRKFLTKTARAQKQSIMFFRDPFKLVPIEKLAEIADKMTRNEIMTKNEFRPILGLKPSKDPKADMLINSNINQSNNVAEPPEPATEEHKEEENQNGAV
jgi:hypothetical protein